LQSREYLYLVVIQGNHWAVFVFII
jgi:hypothetical protein